MNLKFNLNEFWFIAIHTSSVQLYFVDLEEFEFKVKYFLQIELKSYTASVCRKTNQCSKELCLLLPLLCAFSCITLYIYSRFIKYLLLETEVVCSRASLSKLSDQFQMTFQNLGGFVSKKPDIFAQVCSEIPCHTSKNYSGTEGQGWEKKKPM